jgi:hypothetical protein
MSAQFRGAPRGPQGRQHQQGTPNYTRKFEDEDDDDEQEDEHVEGAAETPPGLKLAVGIFELCFGIFTNFVQVATSTLAFVSMIMGASVALKGIPDLIHEFPWYCVIGLTLAGAIQGFLHKSALPMSSTYLRLRHIQHFNIRSTSSWEDVRNTITAGTVLFIVAILGDITSDATFVNLFTRNALIILFWIVFLTGSSTLLMYDGWTRIFGAREDFKDYNAYHREYDEEYQ